MPAADKTVEIKHYSIDSVILGRLVQSVDQVAGLIFAHRCLSGKERGERIDFGTFFHDGAVECEKKCPVTNRGRARPGGEDGEERRKEQQHENEHEPVLYAYQQAPHFSGKSHP